VHDNTVGIWTDVKITPPQVSEQLTYLVWVKTPSGRGKPAVYKLLQTEALDPVKGGDKFWYNGNGDEDLEYDEVTHYAVILKPI